MNNTYRCLLTVETWLWHEKPYHSSRGAQPNKHRLQGFDANS